MSTVPKAVWHPLALATSYSDSKSFLNMFLACSAFRLIRVQGKSGHKLAMTWAWFLMFEMKAVQNCLIRFSHVHFVGITLYPIACGELQAERLLLKDYEAFRILSCRNMVGSLLQDRSAANMCLCIHVHVYIHTHIYDFHKNGEWKWLEKPMTWKASIYVSSEA